MNHRQEIQSAALEIVNITKWIITNRAEQTVPMTQQIESMTEWILDKTEEIIGIPQNIGMTKNHTYIASNNGLHWLNCTYMIEDSIH